MRKLKFVVLLAALISGGGKCYAHDIEVANVDGVTIYYNFNYGKTELAVTYKGSSYYNADYAGKVVIPNSVTYNGKTYPVTSIGGYAFYQCLGLTEVTIGNSVTSIGLHAFDSCRGLTQLTIGNGVTSIGLYAFQSCSGLTELTIGNSVTSIGDGAFGDCIGLTKVAILGSVTSVGQYAFRDCEKLTEVTIGNSVTSIGGSAFSGCSALTELTIGSSVTSIGSYAFRDCKKLTEVTIPNSVTSIGGGAFQDCSGLKEVTLGNSVISIGAYAFRYCSGLTTIYSLNTTPPYVAYTDTFYNLYATVDVFVPQEALEAYQTANVWKEFQKLHAIGGTEQCATPTIHYANNELIFNCETEGVTYKSTITDADIASYSSDRVKLGVTYTITVRATKADYADSETATATLCWIDVEPKTEGITDDTAVRQISATPVLIQSANGQITVTGLTDGTTVTVYTLSGQQVGTATSTGGQATVSTSLTTGTAAIVKMGDTKSVKIAVK